MQIFTPFSSFQTFSSVVVSCGKGSIPVFHLLEYLCEKRAPRRVIAFLSIQIWLDQDAGSFLQWKRSFFFAFIYSSCWFYFSCIRTSDFMTSALHYICPRYRAQRLRNLFTDTHVHTKIRNSLLGRTTTGAHENGACSCHNPCDHKSSLASIWCGTGKKEISNYFSFIACYILDLR